MAIAVGEGLPIAVAIDPRLTPSVDSLPKGVAHERVPVLRVSGH